MRSHLILRGLALALAATPALAADPTTAQAPDTWRASKLIGVPIYGPDTVTVGKVDDLLLGHDGRIVTVVVGVGGFLGVGEKDVALPFGQVSFSATPVAAPSNPPMADATAPAALAPNAAPMPAVPPTASVPAAGVAAGAAALPAPPPPSTSTAYPDHGTISMTKDELKGMPTLQFAK